MGLKKEPKKALQLDFVKVVDWDLQMANHWEEQLAYCLGLRMGYHLDGQMEPLKESVLALLLEQQMGYCWG